MNGSVLTGAVCMKCLRQLISKDSVVCRCGHPVYCEECWKALPKSRKDEGAPYFNKKTGEIFTG